MKVTVIIVSLFVITCFFGFACKKNEVLPPVTTTGEGTMGFLIDGKNWVAHSNDFKIYRATAKFYSPSVFISAVNNSVSHIEILLSNPKVGQYQFSTSDKIEYKRYGAFPIFSLDSNNPSNDLLITYYDEKIISGKFSFKLKSPDDAIVSITSGRFDIPIK